MVCIVSWCLDRAKQATIGHALENIVSFSIVEARLEGLFVTGSVAFTEGLITQPRRKREAWRNLPRVLEKATQIIETVMAPVCCGSKRWVDKLARYVSLRIQGNLI